MKREIIEAQLKELGVAEEKIKNAVDKIMAENGKDVEAEKAKITAKENELTTANNTIKDLQETVKKFDGKDPDKLQQDLKDLQTKYDTDVATERKKAETLQKEYGLKDALKNIGVLDPDYLIYKVGGTEKFAFNDKGEVVGLEETIMPYKESSPSLFAKSDDNDNNNGNDNSGFRANSGGSHGGGGTPDYDKMSDEEYYAAISKKKEE